jgi:hypothetical protein
MKTWDEMEPRERDAWVAEHVMGWTWIAYWKGAKRDVRVRALFEPGKCLGKIDDPECPWGCITPAGDEPAEIYSGAQFSADANADILVLKHIAATWPHEKTNAFVNALTTIRWPRSNVSVAFSLELFSEIGDYSHAAYLALTGATQ